MISIQGNSGPMVLHKCLALATCILAVLQHFEQLDPIQLLCRMLTVRCRLIEQRDSWPLLFNQYTFSVSSRGNRSYPTIRCNSICHWFRIVESIPIFLDRYHIGWFSKWSPNVPLKKWCAPVLSLTYHEVCTMVHTPVISQWNDWNPRSTSIKGNK